MKMGTKSSWEEEQSFVAEERQESEWGKNKDKKIVMVKLIILRKKIHQVKEQQKIHSVW
jgi:hypothetical protein